MRKPLFFITIIFSGLMLTFCSEPGGQPGVRQVSVSRTVEIPLQIYAAEGAALDPQTLTATAGAEDELPQGPASFDVLPDGGFVISDPLRERLVYYDSMGKFIREEALGAAAGSVRFLEGEARFEMLYGDEVFRVNAQRQVEPLESQLLQPETPARRLGGSEGIVIRSAPEQGAPDTLQIQWKSDTETLVSLQNLGADAGGNSYVALEVSSGGDPIQIRKIIRKYDSTGNVSARIEDISLDYFALPIDQFRVKDGRVYQMAVEQDKAVIYVWDTN